MAGWLPRAGALTSGVFCFNPPYGVRIGGDAGEEAFGHAPVMKKPASNAELPGVFLVYQL